MHLLAQARPSLGPILFWLGLILGAALVGGVILLYLRRRVLAPESKHAAPARLLDDLRAMYERGEISRLEFDTAKATMAARLAGKASPRPLTPPAAVRGHDGSLIARPGIDLTGDPLPHSPEPPGDPPANTPEPPRL